MRTESRSAITFGGDGLLLGVDPFAVRVLRTDQNRAGGTHGSEPAAGDRAVAPEHKNVVTQCLEVVRNPVARILFSLVVKHRPFLIRLLFQMAAVTARRP